METHKAIPQGYMTVGEVAKKMNTTVRTMQYYDKEGVLSPSAESDGGRRLYTDKDIIKLHQIQCMKFLGFSLDDIKNRLIPIDTPEEMTALLAEHASAMREKITALSESLQAIEALSVEVMQMRSVDFSKYAAIIVSLQMKNEYYSLIKHFDDNTLEQFYTRFSGNKEGAASAIETLNNLLDEAIQYQKDGVRPESDEGLELAKEFWDTVLSVTGGDPAMISKIMEIAENADGDGKWKRKQEIANKFIEPALGAYFSKTGINPFEGAAKQ
ncbi:MAG: MerR family transcriptional regulator [Oscillospiraceae bacterium]|jgi:DNA-binding transcriptional MerR regulator|nr:MerR family transcriptional regulator [Oscillospiraceae bacterium]